MWFLFKLMAKKGMPLVNNVSRTKVLGRSVVPSFERYDHITYHKDLIQNAWTLAGPFRTDVTYPIITSPPHPQLGMDRTRMHRPRDGTVRTLPFRDTLVGDVQTLHPKKVGGTGQPDTILNF